ncbi:hypothetical protein V1523DRAFT_414314 [Lipomyces doorenjongii]
MLIAEIRKYFLSLFRMLAVLIRYLNGEEPFVAGILRESTSFACPLQSSLAIGRVAYTSNPVETMDHIRQDEDLGTKTTR